MKNPFMNFSPTTSMKHVWYLWIRHYKALFVMSFLFLTAFAGYQWYQDLYRYHWTEEERTAYLTSTAKETTFQEKKFLGVLNQLDQEHDAHLKSIHLDRDLFAGARKKRP